jgi:hypothetical protein
MTTFNEQQHPRASAGTFAIKRQSPPERLLVDTEVVRIPDVGIHGSIVDGIDVGTPGIAGYMYKADIYSPAELLAVLVHSKVLSPGALGMNVEWALDQHAGANAVDRDDEYTFDSDDFPKVIAETEVTIHEHAALGREYWNFPDIDDDPRDATDALHEWVQTLDTDLGDFNLREKLLDGTNYNAEGSVNIAMVAANAVAHSIDLTVLGYPLPTRHN